MVSRMIEVLGWDAMGELHVFCTDDPHQGEAVRLQMVEKLQDVQMVERD